MFIEVHMRSLAGQEAGVLEAFSMAKTLLFRIYNHHLKRRTGVLTAPGTRTWSADDASLYACLLSANFARDATRLICVIRQRRHSDRCCRMACFLDWY